MLFNHQGKKKKKENNNCGKKKKKEKRKKKKKGKKKKWRLVSKGSESFRQGGQHINPCVDGPENESEHSVAPVTGPHISYEL